MDVKTADQAQPGNQPATSHTPNLKGGCSSLPIIGCRLPASSSFVLARA